MLDALDRVLHVGNFDNPQCPNIPPKYAHIWKTDDPLEWFNTMFNRSWETKTENGLRSNEERSLSPSLEEEIQDTIAEILNRRALEEERARLQNMTNRGERSRIHGADRNNNVFARLVDRFGQHNVVLIRDEILANMTAHFPEDYPHNTQEQQIQPELIPRENPAQGNNNGNEEF